jgi:1,4-alpha-glucan branching enzyme
MCLLDEYEWKYDSCFLPPDEELVIYEIHVGDFTGGEGDPKARGKFRNILEKIDYLKQLGVNASMWIDFDKNNTISFLIFS